MLIHNYPFTLHFPVLLDVSFCKTSLCCYFLLLYVLPDYLASSVTSEGASCGCDELREREMGKTRLNELQILCSLIFIWLLQYDHG